MANQKSKSTATKKPTASKNSSTKSPTSKTKAQSQVELKSVSAQVIQIPLNKLALSPKNVRKVKPSEADDVELKSSIFENGVKQNLAGYEDGKGGYLIDAGGRRLKALQQLAKEGKITNDHPINCLIEEEAEATITSTLENLQRAAMHPADQFAAFAEMIAEGRSEDEIAIKFGVSVDIVRRRLKLARVAPEILEQFRQDEVTLEIIMAFTLCDDHDRQMTVWNAVKDGWQLQPHVIKRMLTESSYSASHKLAVFVGVEAYQAAGGTIITDLFSERDNTHLENPELLERLAVEKLQEASKAHLGQWKWVDVHLEIDHDAFRSFGRVDPIEADPDPKLVAEIETLNAREDELYETSENRDWSEEERMEYHAIAPRITSIEAQIENARPYADEDRAIAGIVITLTNQGDLKVEKGLVRPEDIPAPDPSNDANEDEGGSRVSSPTSSSPAPVADPAAAMRRADGITAGLADDLRTSRHHILRAHLSADYDVAFDVMLYTICSQAFSSSYRGDQPIDISLTQYHANNREKLVADSVADKMLEAMKATLRLEWSELNAPEDFRALSALPIQDKQALFAWATAYALKAQLASDNRPNSVIEELGARMDVDVAACWRPTAANYWGTVTKAYIASVAKDVISEDYADERGHEKKGEAAAAMELAFAENAATAGGVDQPIANKTTRWLPKGMEFSEADFVDEVLDGEAEDGNANQQTNADNIPAFLSEDAA